MDYLKVRVGQGIIEDKGDRYTFALSNFRELLQKACPSLSTFLRCRVAVHERHTLLQLIVHLTQKTLHSREATSQSTRSKFQVDFWNG